MLRFLQSQAVRKNAIIADGFFLPSGSLLPHQNNPYSAAPITFLPKSAIFLQDLTILWLTHNNHIKKNPQYTSVKPVEKWLLYSGLYKKGYNIVTSKI